MTHQRATTHNDLPEEVAAAIIIALQSRRHPHPLEASPSSAWAASGKVAPSWHDHERANLWRREDRERGWRKG